MTAACQALRSRSRSTAHWSAGVELSADTLAAVDEALGDVPIKEPVPAPFAKPGVMHR